LSFGVLGSNFLGNGFDFLKKIELCKKALNSDKNQDDADHDCENDGLELFATITTETPVFRASKKHYYCTASLRYTGGHWHISIPPPRS
jgi:hypothetical protein